MNKVVLDNLERLRKELGLTKSQFAKKAKVSSNYFKKISTGKNVNVRMLGRFCLAYSIPMHRLFLKEVDVVREKELELRRLLSLSGGKEYANVINCITHLIHMFNTRPKMIPKSKLPKSERSRMNRYDDPFTSWVKSNLLYSDLDLSRLVTSHQNQI